MKGLVAYSRPRGKFGRFIYTVAVDFEAGLDEAVGIELARPQIANLPAQVYSCDHCGRWATITVTRPTTTYTPLEPSEHRKEGRLELFRYDNVEPGDLLTIRMRDSDLLFMQITKLYALLEDEKMTPYSQCYPIRNNADLGNPPSNIYNVRLVNWNDHISERQEAERETTIEEELIQQTMNAEPITIKELLLEPAGQVPQLEDGTQFIEGNLRYL